MRKLYNKVRQPWGGATIDMVAGGMVPDGIDAYAVTVTADYGEAIKVPSAGLTEAGFVAAYTAAVRRFRGAGWLGIFEFDAVTVTTREGVDELFATGRYPVDGGAYHFATGDGYWPQGRPDAYKEAA